MRSRRHVPAVPAAPPPMRDCPCGGRHPVTPALDQLIRDGGSTRPVLGPAGAWNVPLVFAAFHGCTSDVLHDAAKRYGFEPIPSGRDGR